MDVSVHVELDGATVPAGTLFTHHRRGVESATFAYGGSYVGMPGAYAFDLELPLVTQLSDAASADLEQLWRRIVFSILISNTDDHLRNHGFLHRHDDIWRLSPAFDLNPDPAPGPAYLSTAIDVAETRADLRLALSVVTSFRLTSSHARAILAEVAAAVSRWREVAASHDLNPAEIAAMAPAFAALTSVDG